LKRPYGRWCGSIYLELCNDFTHRRRIIDPPTRNVPKNARSPEHDEAVAPFGQPVIGVPITAAARLSSTKIGKPWRRSNWQRRQCLNVGDNIDDDRTLRLDRPGDRRAKLVWFFDADAERANLFGHAGKINGSKGP
jgi:hypothetical protein